jgi:protein involved in polysaccharide export with SLBB domain/capsular polysaccharide biosynthesis protein
MVLDALLPRWYWLALGGCVMAGLFFLLGERFVKPKFTASAQLLRYETPGEADFFKNPMSGETFAGIIRSPDLLRQVGAQAEPPIPPEIFARMIKVDPDPDSDMVKLLLASRDPHQAVTLMNLYASNSVVFVRAWFAQRAQVVANEYLKQQVGDMDRDITVLSEKFNGLNLPPQVTSKLAQVGGQISQLNTNLTTSPAATALISRQTERLNTLMLELSDLLGKYTDLNPLVEAKRNQIKAVETQIATARTNTVVATASGEYFVPTRTPEGPGAFNPQVDLIRTKLLALENGRVQLATRQREAELYASNPPGVVRVFAPATIQTLQSNHRRVKIAAVTIFGGVLGVFAGLGLVLFVELLDRRLKTSEDVRRVTKLPVLTTLGHLEKMNDEARTQWAFRTWTMLQGRLSRSANHGLVCGFTSSSAKEGRSTWITLLAEAASMTGFRVLTIATKSSQTHAQLTDANHGGNSAASQEIPKAKESAVKPPKPGNNHVNGANGANGGNGSENHSMALSTSALASPSQVTEQLTGPNSQPIVHIPLPGWVWNRERRQQWGQALEDWRKIDNLVILVELPPAGVPEAVLLGSNLPNMVWLTDSGAADAAQTRVQLETLRNAKCNLVGAVLNHEPAMPLRSRFPRWLGCVALMVLGLSASAAAPSASNSETLVRQDAAVQPADFKAATASPAGSNAESKPGSDSLPTQGNSRAEATPSAAGEEASTNEVGFSIVRPSQRAAWQERLTLGPGDVLNFGLYGQPELARIDIAVGPDGRVSYLQAQDILASGATVDELRAKFDQELGKWYRSPHTIITPMAFKSKKYYMLGKIMVKGVYSLDRPLTVLEAIARAKGFENGLVDRNVIDLADFRRSFLMRGGKRYALDFEQLFQRGDLSQNLAVEPNDYIYIAPANVGEVYVVGEVRLPGAVTYTAGMNIIAAITARGGYTDRAFKMRVAVVRGSLSHPETFAVDTHAILDGKGQNFKLEPNDIIFVNSRPFILVEELADLAATAFIQSIITSWVGVDVVKPFRQ